MRKFQDLTGQKFGRLTAIELVEKAFLDTDGRYHNTRWRFKCQCGNERIAQANNVKSGRVQSCGCLKTKHGHSVGRKRSPEYSSYSAMITRCTNPNQINFADYGGRGITVCDRWLDSFENFLADMGPRPMGTSIDRIDNDLGYFRDNCRWATSKEQLANRRPYKRRKSTNEYFQGQGPKLIRPQAFR